MRNISFMPENYIFKAGIAVDLINLDKPVKVFTKYRIFFLCGIADEPFCFLSKNSSTSATSVLCKCLISIANLSIELDIIVKKIEHVYLLV